MHTPIPSAPRSDKPQFLWLEALRGCAAVWVVLHHAVLSVENFYGELGPAWQALENGYLGVDFFFVLSGFIIALSCDRLAASGRGLGDYLSARVIRIYVPYLPIGIALLALYALSPSISEGRPAPGLLTSLTLLPSQAPPALAVAWTLVHEVLFYALFSFFFVSRALLVGMVGLWSALIVAVWAYQVPAPPAAAYLLSPLNLCFVAGVLAFHATRSGVGRRTGLAALLVGVGLVAPQALSDEPVRWLVALGFTAWVVAAVSKARSLLSPGRSLLLLGAASYSIYLVHSPALSGVVRAVRAGVPALGPPGALVVIALLSVLAGLAYFHVYERHALRFVRRRWLMAPGG